MKTSEQPIMQATPEQFALYLEIVAKELRENPPQFTSLMLLGCSATCPLFVGKWGDSPEDLISAAKFMSQPIEIKVVTQ